MDLILEAMRLPWPPNWAEVFGRAAPLVVEIGFGNGEFLADLARQSPDINFVGIERAQDPIRWAESRVGGLENVRLVWSDAHMALHALFEPASVQAFHLNFSDPWTKKRHHERRLINADFLKVLATRLVRGGWVYLATDIAQYAGEIGLALGQTAGLKNAYASPWMSERDNPSVRTSYERKAIAVNRPRHYFKWFRTDAPLPPSPVLTEELPMPNARLILPFGLEHVLQNFPRETFRHEERVIRLYAIYQNPHHPKLLIEVLLEEPLFSQRLMIELVAREGEENEFLLRFSPIGYPRATRGVHEALVDVMNWLVGLGAEVLDGSFRH